MAFTDRYVTQAAGGGGDGSSGNPWTLAEGFANIAAGEILNVQSDGAYSIGADSITNAGTTSSLIVVRGYNSTIGDLANQGYNSDGSLDTTNYPDITLTGTLTGNANVVLQNLNFSGALSTRLIGSSSVDRWAMVECAVTNSQSNASASCVLGDNYVTLIDCDLECSATTHGPIVQADIELVAIGCRLKHSDTTTSRELIRAQYGKVLGCLFHADGSAKGHGIWIETGGPLTLVCCNTFYNLETCVQFPNALSSTHIPILYNNHATDCSKWLDHLYSATANTVILEAHSRTRDNTTPRTGIGDSINLGEITTDTGGASTDYEDAGNGNFFLISGAPGRGLSSKRFRDIGAYQHEDAGGGGGTTGRQGLHPIGVGAV